MSKLNVEFQGVRGGQVAIKTFIMKISGRAPNNTIIYPVDVAEALRDQLSAAIEVAKQSADEAP